MSVLAAYIVPHPPMIVPAVGRGSEKQIETTSASYRRAAAEITSLNPDTVILTSPHATMYADYFHISPGKGAKGSLAQFRAPDVRFDVKYDEALVHEIERLAGENDLPAGTELYIQTAAPMTIYGLEAEAPAAEATK